MGWLVSGKRSTYLHCDEPSLTSIVPDTGSVWVREYDGYGVHWIDVRL
jgi:hypothetical protein